MISQSNVFDIVIVGSGPSGVQAAVEAVSTGARVALVDIGETDDKYKSLIPDIPFSELRQTDQNQHEYLLGDADAALANLSRAGAHLTPPRQYMIRGMDALFGFESESFFPLQSTSAGGLGVSWGANVFGLEDFELDRIGLPSEALKKYYQAVAADVGVSAPSDSFGDFLAPWDCRQPALPPDTNARSILQRYAKSQAKYEQTGFRLGQSALAMLSQDLGERRANRLTDMDFYGDINWSVYRPQFTLATLLKSENFTYLTKRKAIRFQETEQHVELLCENIPTGQSETVFCRRLILAAGAINSGRLTLASQPQFGNKLPILCNPNHWVAAINLSMLGRPAAEARHSLAQLTALQQMDLPEKDYALAQFYSYRSLLHFRMLRSIPLPPRQGVTFLRLIATALTCVNLHFSDSPADTKSIELKGDRLIGRYEHTPAQKLKLQKAERMLLRRLVGLRCIPMGVARPANGASIHYAGTLPISKTDEPFHCGADGKLYRTSNVYVADGATWNFLPAKGLTFTLMANARRIAAIVAGSLQK
jgi:hypothetical protein